MVFSFRIVVLVQVPKLGLVSVRSQEIPTNSLLRGTVFTGLCDVGVSWLHMSLGSRHKGYFLFPLSLLWGKFSLQSKEILDLLYVLSQMLGLRILKLNVLLVAIEHCYVCIQIFQMAGEMIFRDWSLENHPLFRTAVSSGRFDLFYGRFTWWNRMCRQQWPLWKSAIQIFDVSSRELSFLSYSHSIPWRQGPLLPFIRFAFFKQRHLCSLSFQKW